MTADELSDDEVEALLRRANTGTLSLAEGGDTYAVPQSFGYDGETLYFQLAYDDDSRKMEYIETTTTATFTVYEERPAQSVIVQGPLEPVPEGEETLATNAIAENAVIPTLNVSLDTPLEALRFDFYRLVPESLSGWRFHGFGEQPNG